MDGGSAGRERSRHVVDDCKRLVVDADQCQCAGGGRLVDCRHRRDGVADIADFVGTQRRLVLHDDAEAILTLDVVGCHDRHDARQFFRGRNVDGNDPRMRNSGPQDARHQHAGPAMVREISELTGHLVLDIRTNAPTVGQHRTRHLDLRRRGCRPRRHPCRRARRTADFLDRLFSAESGHQRVGGRGLAIAGAAEMI